MQIYCFCQKAGAAHKKSINRGAALRRWVGRRPPPQTMYAVLYTQINKISHLRLRALIQKNQKNQKIQSKKVPLTSKTCF